MGRVVIMGILAVVVGFLSGCGTVNNILWIGPLPEELGLKDDPEFRKIYGGVSRDIKDTRDSFIDATRAETIHDVRFLWFIFDLPFSAVGDTLTLPCTLNYQWRKPADSAVK